MENNKQTAVEWLFEKINMFCMFTDGIPDEWSEALEQAKEMEKQQIIDAWTDGNDSEIRGGKVMRKIREQYYMEEYGKQ